MLLQDTPLLVFDARLNGSKEILGGPVAGVARGKQSAARFQQWQCSRDKPAVILLSPKCARLF
jgi:hypothetical protein